MIYAGEFQKFPSATWAPRVPYRATLNNPATIVEAVIGLVSIGQQFVERAALTM
jgi:hypothetical protein